MANDDPKEPPAHRQRILDEIRRRAEEAEAKRLEEEDEIDDQISETSGANDTLNAPPAPFPIPEGVGSAPAARSVQDQKIVILRERLQIALDRGRLEKAKEQLAELRTLVPDDPQLQTFEARVEALETTAKREQEKKREEKKRAEEEKAKAKTAPAIPPPPEPKPPTPSQRQPAPPPVSAKRDPIKDREERQARRKKIGAILDQVNGLYQQEKYDKALETLNGVFTIEPEHEDARVLRGQIEKAKQFSDLIKREEAKRKAEQPARGPSQKKPASPSTPADKDVWGTQPTNQQQQDIGFELPPQEKGPIAPPKPPLIDRLGNKLMKIRIPVKPILTVAVLLVVAFLAYRAVENIVTAVVPRDESILVLPAIADPLDSTLVAMADGTTDGLILDLSQASRVRVINATTTLALKNVDIRPSALARTMGANFTLQWTFTRNGDMVQLQTSLVDTATGATKWSTTRAFAPREAMTVRADMFDHILSALELKPGTYQSEPLQRRATLQPDAYMANMRARAMARQPGLYGDGAVIAAFEDAVQRDSTFGEAEVGLGLALMKWLEEDKHAPASELTRALFCVQSAMGAGLRTPEVFRLWGMIEQFRGQYDNAERRYREAVDAAPSDAESQRRYALLLAIRGEVDPSIAAARRAATDDPVNSEVWSTFGLVQQVKVLFKPEGKEDLRAALRSYEQGYRVAADRSAYAAGFYTDLLIYLDHHDQAIDILNDRIARNPGDPMSLYKLGRAEQAAGHPVAEWQGTFGRARDILRGGNDDPVTISELALVYTRYGTFKEASASIAVALRKGGDDPDVLFNAARMYALQRDKKLALNYLTKSLAKRYSVERVMDMDFYNLRTDDDFIAAVQR
jgi:tetratricopeptide (TPR) repeat protein